MAATVRALSPEPADAATVRLAALYAEAIDAGACAECGKKGDVLDRLGPKLLAALVEIGATPRARGAKGGGQGGQSALDRLRAARTS